MAHVPNCHDGTLSKNIYPANVHGTGGKLGTDSRDEPISHSWRTGNWAIYGECWRLRAKAEKWEFFTQAVLYEQIPSVPT